jgi:DNA recombination protein RmuC
VASQAHLIDTFKALASDTLHANSAAFLQLAESKWQQTHEAANAKLDQKTAAIDEMVKPVKETLQRMDNQIQALEVKREGAYRELAEMVAASRQTQLQLRAETSQLLQALRAPTARGRWGELQLQRLLEMTGMSAHAKDFTTQSTISDEDGAIRPDVIVALPGDRAIVIDSKVPLAAYLDSVQTDDEAVRLAALKQHARALKDHIKKLSAKSYWEKVEGAPDFVVLFLPGEHFLSAALDGDGDLMEFSIGQNVVLATPMTLVALLRTVAQSWRQDAIANNVRQVAELGRKLYGALGAFTKQMDQVGSRLGNTVESYNKAVRALEGAVMGKARAFETLGAAEANESLNPLDTIDQTPRAMALAAESHDDETQG